MNRPASALELSAIRGSSLVSTMNRTGRRPVQAGMNLWSMVSGIEQVVHRLVLEHINRGIAGPARAQRGHERTGFNQRRAAGIDQHGLRSHARQILGFDDVARRRHQPHMQRDDIASLEKFRLAARRRVSARASDSSRAQAMTFMPNALP